MITNGRKEHPILFSSVMVRAILEGRKTQTRRVVVQPKRISDDWKRADSASVKVAGKPWEESRYVYAEFFKFDGDGSSFGHIVNSIACPYGKPKDRLWVRETFVLQHDVRGEAPPFADGRPIRRDAAMDDEWTWIQPHYRATDGTPDLSCFEPHKCDGGEPCCHWTPSIFMPRWASRITLEITDVRVERLQAISEADANAEGMEWDGRGETLHPVNRYREGWNAINKKRGYSWETNPFVWVISFKRIEQLST